MLMPIIYPLMLIPNLRHIQLTARKDANCLDTTLFCLTCLSIQRLNEENVSPSRKMMSFLIARKADTPKGFPTEGKWWQLQERMTKVVSLSFGAKAYLHV